MSTVGWEISFDDVIHGNVPMGTWVAWAERSDQQLTRPVQRVRAGWRFPDIGGDETWSLTELVDFLAQAVLEEGIPPTGEAGQFPLQFFAGVRP